MEQDIDLNSLILRKAQRVHDGTDRMELSKYDTAEIIQVVKNWFTALGWKTKESKVKINGFISRKNKDHVKIHWSIEQGWRQPRGYAYLSKLTPNGGWCNVQWDANLSTLIKSGVKVSAPVLITKNTLPDPVRLGVKSDNTISTSLTISGTGTPVTLTSGSVSGGTTWDIKARIVLNNIFSEIAVINAVGLKHNGVLSQKAIFKPEEQIWFHMICTTYNRTPYHIITDGEILHPVRMLRNSNSQKFKVTSNTARDLKYTTSTDKKLICKAIEYYLFEANKN